MTTPEDPRIEQIRDEIKRGQFWPGDCVRLRDDTRWQREQDGSWRTTAGEPTSRYPAMLSDDAIRAYAIKTYDDGDVYVFGSNPTERLISLVASTRAELAELQGEANPKGEITQAMFDAVVANRNELLLELAALRGDLPAPTDDRSKLVNETDEPADPTEACIWWSNKWSETANQNVNLMAAMDTDDAGRMRVFDAVRDTLWRCVQYGTTEDGDTAMYIVSKGTVHRLVGAMISIGQSAPLRVASDVLPDAAAVGGDLPKPDEATKTCSCKPGDAGLWCAGRPSEWLCAREASLGVLPESSARMTRSGARRACETKPAES